jgi:hypothetical protein
MTMSWFNTANCTTETLRVNSARLPEWEAVFHQSASAWRGADASYSVALSPERTRGVFWDFQGPFGVMGANSQFGLIQTRYGHQYLLTLEQLGKIAATTRFHASLNPGAIFRQPFTVEDYVNSRILSDPMRLLDCVPIVNGGLAYVVTSAQTARAVTDRPVYLLGFGEANNYYHGSRSRPDITYTLASQTTYPSWGYMIGRGATTIWKNWWADMDNRDFDGSGNHVMLVGDLVIWLVEHLAGLREFSAGAEIEKPANAAIGLANTIDVYVHNAIDPQAERRKLLIDLLGGAGNLRIFLLTFAPLCVH